MAQTPNTILRTVDDHYNHLTSLRTRYVEHYTGMGLDRSESGTLLLKKPGRMRWSYDHPAGKLFVFDGKYAWFYSPGAAQVQRLSAKQIDDLHTPLRLLLGHTQLQKELDGISVTENAAGFHIVGTPRGMQARLKQLSLEVTPAGSITAMTIEEQDGSSTAFTFTDAQENVPTQDKEFTFNAPPGVAIVEGTKPM